MKKKICDLIIILGIYLLASVIGALICLRLNRMMLKLFVFDAAATVVVFVFSVLLHNSSVYDAYWSFMPMVMAVWLFAAEKAWSVMHIVFLAIFLAWSVRLTGNWIAVFTDFSYEDWRYRKFRDETPRLLWPIVNFCGIHLMPTLVVFAGMLPLFVLVRIPMNLLSLPGMAVMGFGILLEFFADRQMHAFLGSGRKGEVCEFGLWRYSRHPNYLGEIFFWLGVYLAMLPLSVTHWMYGIGFLSITVMFNVVSVPLMEKRQLARRPAYWGIPGIDVETASSAEKNAESGVSRLTLTLLLGGRLQKDSAAVVFWGIIPYRGSAAHLLISFSGIAF